MSEHEAIPSVLAPLLAQHASTPEAASDYEPFITFHLRSGTQLSNRYEHLLWIVLRMDGELVLRYSNHTLHLRGRNLAVLHEEIKRLKTRFVLELDERYDVDDGDGPVVTSIRIGDESEEDLAQLCVQDS